jgi:drug/metabolite transporter (DMT)-like permease
MNPLKGILLKVLAVSIFTAMASLVKITSDVVPPGQAVFFRSFFALPIILGTLTWQGRLRGGLRTDRPFGHVVRGLAGSLAMGLRFFAFGVLTLPEVTAIGFTTPLVLVLLAALFLGEHVRLVRASLVAVGFVGVLIILWPRLQFDQGGQLQTWGAIAALVSAVSAAFAQASVRKLTATENTATIVFYFCMTTTFLSLLTIPFGWVVPDHITTALLICAGLLGGVGQICLTSCYRHAQASLVAPFDYSAMLLALAIGYFAFGEHPTGQMLIGAGIIIASGIAIIWREHRLGLKRPRGKAGTAE